MERIESETVYDGKLTDVLRATFRRADGEEVEREVVSHPDAVGIVVHDDRVVYLVRQPREAVEEDALLEIPAGKLDTEGETPLETAQRELAEEIGKSAERVDGAQALLHDPGLGRRGGHALSGDRASPTPRRRPTTASGSRSSSGRSAISTRRSPSAPTPSPSSAC